MWTSKHDPQGKKRCHLEWQVGYFSAGGGDTFASRRRKHVKVWHIFYLEIKCFYIRDKLILNKFLILYVEDICEVYFLTSSSASGYRIPSYRFCNTAGYHNSPSLFTCWWYVTKITCAPYSTTDCTIGTYSKIITHTVLTHFEEHIYVIISRE